MLLQHVATRSFVLPIGFEASTAFLLTPVDTDSIALPIHKNGELIGHIEFNVGEGMRRGWRGPARHVCRGDACGRGPVRAHRSADVLAPDVADGIASDLSITFAARTGTI